MPFDTFLKYLINIYTFHCLMKLSPIPENQFSFEILQLLMHDVWKFSYIIF